MTDPSESEDNDLAALQPVPGEWLARFEDGRDARRVAELQADAELLNRLMWEGYGGPAWDRFADRLARYGITVIEAWIRSGAIFTRSANRGWPLKGPQPDRDDAEDLAVETVGVAIVKFRSEVLIPRVWRLEGGASLKTFFIGQCLIRYPNIYRAWARDRRRNSTQPLLGDAGVDLRETWSDPGPDPLASLVAGEGARETIGRIVDPATREIVIYKSQGYTDAEIAELVGLALSAVKSRLFRLRRKERGVA